MNLLQLRQQFRSISGRFDLVESDGTNTGANFYINAGQRHLDRMDENQKSWGIAYRLCEANYYSVQFKWCRAVKEVWAATASARWQLEKMNLQDLMSNYLTKPPSGRDSGNTLFYSPAVTKAAPETFNVPADEFEAFSGFVDILSGDHFAYNSILMAPPTSERIQLEIRGLFYTDPLNEDADKNYWSEVHPDVLIMATMRHLEVINRNTQGVNDWDKAISAEVSGIGKDLVEELIAEVSQIEN